MMTKINRLTTYWWDEDQGKNRNLVITDLIDRDTLTFEGHLDAAHLSDEQLAYGLDYTSIQSLKGEFLTKVELSAGGGGFQRHDLAGHGEQSGRRLLFFYDKMKRLEIYNKSSETTVKCFDADSRWLPAAYKNRTPSDSPLRAILITNWEELDNLE